MASFGKMLQNGNFSYFYITSIFSILLHENGTQYKWYLENMASHKISILQKWYLKTYIIGFLKY